MSLLLFPKVFAVSLVVSDTEKIVYPPKTFCIFGYSNQIIMAKDVFHMHVKAALISDGWEITHDPYYLKIDEITYPIDLGAEQAIAAEKRGEKIAVEVKSFLRDSLVNEFHTALGQYLDYDTNLPFQEPDRQVYLAVADKVFRQMIKIRAILNALERFNLRLLIFDPEKNEIVEWKKF